jgi:hypothetical protein
MECDDDEGLFRTIASRVLRSYRTDPRFERMVLFAALEGHEVALAYVREQSFPLVQLLDEYIARRQAQGALLGLRPVYVLSAIFGMAHHYAQASQMFRVIPDPPPEGSRQRVCPNSHERHPAARSRLFVSHEHLNVAAGLVHRTSFR